MADQTTIVGSPQALSAILLCGLMGVLGQGIRAVVGLKNAGALKSTTPTAESEFSAAYLVLSLMIGFIAGVLAGIAIGLKNFISVDLDNMKALLGIAGSGYVGADFVENTMSIVIPAKPVQASRVSSGSAATTSAFSRASRTSVQGNSAAPEAMAFEAEVAPPADEGADLAAAMSIVCRRVDQSKWVPALTASFAKFGLSTDRRRAAAIGQFLVEAGAAFQEIVENLNYSANQAAKIFPHVFPTPSAALPYIGDQVQFGNHVYANRNGNGDEASGDGYLFRGRGLIQLTGRTEYTQFGNSVNMTAEETAQYCETPEGAAISGCWYLSSKGCLPLADQWNINRITYLVNGSGMIGAQQRLNYANAFLKHLGGG